MDATSFLDENYAVYELRDYMTKDGKDLFATWHAHLRGGKALLAIDRRLQRIQLGNFGDHKSCGAGVWELRIDIGAGYRVYYGRDGTRVILLLCGGDKASQTSDIARAKEYWEDWKERSDER